MKNGTLERPPRPYRFSRKEYYAMGDAGLFADKRVELIAGEIIEMSPHKGPHAFGISNLTAIFFRVLKPGLTVRVQLPLNLRLRSEPEPDLAIIKGQPSDFKINHPMSAELVVEIANASINYDRQTKGSMYAQAGIPEFWLVNLIDNCVEWYRAPVKAKSQPFGSEYSSRQILRSGDAITPLCLPGVKISVSELLP